MEKKRNRLVIFIEIGIALMVFVILLGIGILVFDSIIQKKVDSQRSVRCSLPIVSTSPGIVPTISPITYISPGK
jgi:hypothetical protein